MVVSKRKVKKATSSTGVEVSEIYCRRCMYVKKYSEFYLAVDDLDRNGYFSVCKACCQDIYNGYYRVERDISRALLMTCRKINLKFDEEAVKSTILQLTTYHENGKNTDNVIGIYKSKIVSVIKERISDEKSSINLTFVEPNYLILPENPLDNSKESYDLEQYWGSNLSFEDYQFLEKELADWKKTHRCDTKAEETLLKEICHKTLEIRKKREINNGSSPATLVKELQELMKTASVDPSKTSLANSGRSQDTFSSFIKIIEENEPADYYKDKELFKDFDNIDFYFKKYVTRPLKNFITQSRDFNVDTEDSDDEIVDEIDVNEIFDNE